MHTRAGVPVHGPGGVYSSMVAKEMTKKRQKTEADRDRDRGKREKGGRDLSLRSAAHCFTLLVYGML
jgi:hypothetical protein